RTLRLDALELLDAAPDFDHALDAVLDEGQSRDDLGDALAGEILKIAGLENGDDLVLNIGRQSLVALRLDMRGDLHGGIVDRLGRGQYLLGRRFRAGDDGVELARN